MKRLSPNADQKPKLFKKGGLWCMYVSGSFFPAEELSVCDSRTEWRTDDMWEAVQFANLKNTAHTI